jgi:putative IMPACT (imprinted ancient) family translation regulator
MLALSYNLLERVRLLVTMNNGAVLGEDFSEDVTMTLQIPIESFTRFQSELGEMSAGRLKAEVIESKHTIVKIK